MNYNAAGGFNDLFWKGYNSNRNLRCIICSRTFSELKMHGQARRVAQGGDMKNRVSTKHVMVFFLVAFAVFSFLMVNWDQSL